MSKYWKYYCKKKNKEYKGYKRYKISINEWKKKNLKIEF